MSGLSRRRFVLLGAAALAATAAALGLPRRRAVRRWLAEAPPGRERPGALSLRACGVLRAVAPALLGPPVEPEHYVRFFRWRAEHLPGHRALIERFAARLDAAARRAGAGGFEELPPAAQARLLARLAPARGWRRVWRGIADRATARDSEQVVREFLRVFARTDAWLRSGYEAWPGTPRSVTVPGAEDRA